MVFEVCTVREWASIRSTHEVGLLAGIVTRRGWMMDRDFSVFPFFSMVHGGGEGRVWL